MTPKLSELTALPKNVPIDWFEPAYWNLQLTVREKAHYIADGVHVALPIEQLCEKWEDIVKWKGLSQGDFMEQFGNSCTDHSLMVSIWSPYGMGGFHGLHME